MRAPASAFHSVSYAARAPLPAQEEQGFAHLAAAGWDMLDALSSGEQAQRQAVLAVATALMPREQVRRRAQAALLRGTLTCLHAGRMLAGRPRTSFAPAALQPEAMMAPGRP